MADKLTEIQTCREEIASLKNEVKFVKTEKDLLKQERDNLLQRFVVLVAKLLGDPRGHNMIGEFRFVIFLRTEVPDPVPAFRLVVNFFVESLEPLSRTRSHDIEVFLKTGPAMKHLARGQRLVTTGRKVRR